MRGHQEILHAMAKGSGNGGQVAAPLPRGGHHHGLLSQFAHDQKSGGDSGMGVIQLVLFSHITVHQSYIFYYFT